MGAVLWDTGPEGGGRKAEGGRPVKLLSALVHHPDDDPLNACPPISAEITAITGITQEDIDIYSEPWIQVLRGMNNMALRADAIVAHNGTGFDKPMLLAHLDRLDTPQAPHLDFWRGPWIDTCIDVDYPPSITTRKLTHLAAEHGFLNPFAHRAVSDVLTMLKVLAHYDIGPVLESSRQPNVTLRALVSYDDREKAKGRGYRWDAGTKSWRKTLKAHRVEEERAACGFPVEVLG